MSTRKKTPATEEGDATPAAPDMRSEGRARPKTRRGAAVLFGGAPSDHVADMRALVRVARSLVAGAGATGDFFALYDQLEGACVAAADALRRDEVPACVVEVAAAATVVALAKDYAVMGFVERASALALERPACALTAHRVGLLGCASQSRSAFRFADRFAFEIPDEPHAGALHAVMELLGDGIREAGERLFTLADACPGAPSVLWLAEIAALVMGDGPRLRRSRRALDELLDSEAFGSGGADSASFMQIGRTRLDPTCDDLVRAWRALEGAEPYERAIPLDEPAHYAVTGFRQLHGLEILREALPQVVSLVKVAQAQPN